MCAFYLIVCVLNVYKGSNGGNGGFPGRFGDGFHGFGGGFPGFGGQQQQQPNLYEDDSTVYSLTNSKFPKSKNKYIWYVNR